MSSDLLEKMDFHVHPWENENRIEEFLLEYERRGYRGIAFTDHYEYSFLQGRDFAQERRAIERVKKKHGLSIRVSLSSEIRALDEKGKLDSDAHPEALSLLDYISAGPHHYTAREIENYGRRLLDAAKQTLLSLAERPDVTVILHPFIHIRNHLDFSFGDRDFWEEFAGMSVDNGKVVEIHRDMDERWLPMIEALIRNDVWLVVGSDAHDTGEIDDVKRAVSLVRAVDPGYSRLWLPENGM